MALAEVIDDPDLARYHVAFDPGEMLFMENETSQDLYILLSGKLDVLKGNKKISDITGRGTLFGEMSFLLNNRRSATVKTRTGGRLIKISKRAFISVIKKYPHYGIFLSKVLAQKLVKTNEQAAQKGPAGNL